MKNKSTSEKFLKSDITALTLSTYFIQCHLHDKFIVKFQALIHYTFDTGSLTHPA